ncbi:MAG TPA: alpha-L-arabinofuranosidase [Candidatus Limnocylindria bacterium]|nr:alpha-L-arabinofuranosidase [Candidatus Limnocylindria bacterium]
MNHPDAKDLLTKAGIEIGWKGIQMNRRAFLKDAALLTAGATLMANAGRAQAQAARESDRAVIIDPKPLFDISPHLYMQFMEPLGVTDSSVEAAWDYGRDDWRKDFIDTTRDLAPGMMRFGGLLSRYYKWREGVGPVAKRPPYRNYVWGGWETHRAGTHEFVDFCRRVNSEPMYCVNFLGDGEKRFTNTREGNRTGDAREAADWVSYVNELDHAERKRNGAAEPFNLKFWQLGNETSYGNAVFKKDEAIATTIEFAKAMRDRDRSLKLIGWGDNGWAGDLVDRAGEYINYVAVHMMGQTPLRKETVLRGNLYQAQPERAWEELMEIIKPRIEDKLVALEDTLAKRGSKHPIAITEGHLSLPPHNSNAILTEWLTGVYHARVMNLYQRHGATVKISTAADFNGNRWTSNALIHQVPSGVSYLLPAGAVMRLFKRHNGAQGVAVKSAPSNLDIAASRSGDKIFLHVANMDYSGTTEAAFAIDGFAVHGGRVLEISPENPRQEISPLNPDVFKPREHALPGGDAVAWRFPARSVSVVELDCRGAAATVRD